MYARVGVGDLGLGLAGPLGRLVFLHLPATRLSHRMAWLMACAFGMTGGHSLMEVGAVALGTVLAVAIAFVYSLSIVSRHGVPAPSPTHDRTLTPPWWTRW